MSGTDQLRQLYVLPHWGRSWGSNSLPHPVTVYWHQADQSKRWPYNARRLTGVTTEVPVVKSLVWLDLGEGGGGVGRSMPKAGIKRRSAAIEVDTLTTGPTYDHSWGHSGISGDDAECASHWRSTRVQFHALESNLTCALGWSDIPSQRSMITLASSSLRSLGYHHHHHNDHCHIRHYWLRLLVFSAPLYSFVVS